MDAKFENTKISKSGYWFEKIDLTELQIEKLEALQKLVTEAEERGEKSMLLAQVFPSMAELSVGFLPHEEAYHVLEIINPRGYQKAVKAGEYSNAKFMTPEEWRGLSAESRHKINLFVAEHERMKEQEHCDLCEEPATYRLCQTHMDEMRFLDTLSTDDGEYPQGNEMVLWQDGDGDVCVGGYDEKNG